MDDQAHKDTAMPRKGAVIGDERFRRLVIDFHAGRVGRAELAKHVHAHSTSISLESLERSLHALFPDAKIVCHEAQVKVEHMRATQPRMEKPKYELVRLLFDQESTFDLYNREFFADNPVTTMHIGGGHYAILDGHHRVRRFAELTDCSRPMSVMVVSTTSFDLMERFRQQVEDVRKAIGSADIRGIPLL